jgi:hypothetical protein
MTLEPEADLHWTAFLYVAGELSPEQSSSFELRLAEDQDAREAVAFAVELAGALAIVGPAWSPRGRSHARLPGRRSFVGAAMIAAAACLALAILPALRPTRPIEPDASEVALAWSGLRNGADADWMAFVDDPHTPGPGPASEAVDGVDASTERALPSWLLSAASVPGEEN